MRITRNLPMSADVASMANLARTTVYLVAFTVMNVSRRWLVSVGRAVGNLTTE